MNWRSMLLLGALAPLVTACGGGDDTPPPPVVRLCPNSLDYSTVYTGGGSDGELVQIRIDTTKLTYQITYVDSAVPTTTGTVAPTRTNVGHPVTGTLTPETGLPTTKLNQCAYQLNGASLDPTRPARIFVGEGVMGGTIPGARIQFNGVLGVGVVPDTTFPYYPFIAFSQTETDISKLAGTYNGVGYHLVPSQNFKPVAVDYQMKIATDGSFTYCTNSGTTCTPVPAKGGPFTARTDAAAFTSAGYTGDVPPTLGAPGRGHAVLIVGKLNNQLVPILIRVGSASSTLPDLYADDESGIAMMAPQSTLAANSQNGEYIGVDSQFDYRTTAIEATQATMLDPFNASQASLARALNISYAQTTPGVVTAASTSAAAGSAPTGKFVFSGGVFGYLDIPNASSPYFTIGAFVQ